MALSSGFNITGLELISSGSGYGAFATITLSARDKGQGSGFTGRAFTNASGQIRGDNLTIDSAGANYSSGSWSYIPVGTAINTVVNSGAYSTAWGVTGTTKFYLNSGTFSPTNNTVGLFDSDDNFQVLTFDTFTASGPSFAQGVKGWRRYVNSAATPTITNGTSVFNVERGGTGKAGSFTSIALTNAVGTGSIIIPTIGFNNDISIDDIRTEKGEAQGNNDIHDLYQAFGAVARANKPNFDWYADGPEFGNELETHPIRFDEFFSSTYDAYGGSGCFSVDTPITLPDGLTIPIEDLFVGQEVLALSLPTMPLDFDDEETWKEWETNTIDGAQQTTATVKEIYFDWYKDYYIINDRIKTTYEHPFFVRRDDSRYLFMSTENLKEGDSFLTDTSGSFVFEEITKIEKVEEELETVNINCEPHDVYFAGGVLVHNVHDK